MRPGFPLLLLVATLPAFGQAPELGQGWLPEFELAARQIVSLAEAMPPEKYSWRPQPGVRSVSEVYMHIAVGNLWLLVQAGGKVPAGTPNLPKNPETSVTAKDDVIRWLKISFDAVRRGYTNTDRNKTVKFFGKDTKSDGIFLRILVHDNEHMGQSIAYARVNGVVPPWSKPN